MFNSLYGTVTQKLPQKLYLETNGIEWDLNIPDSSLEKLPPPGQECRVYVYLQHTDSLMNLFAFASESERSLFFDLLKVDGVGPKAAVKIMSSLDSQRLIEILDSGDLAALEKIPGVGKKTAQKMLLQLKGKLSLQDEDVIVVRQKNIPYQAVITALLQMGYEKRMVEDVVSKIASEASLDAAFSALSESEKEDAVFKRAIVALAQ